MTRFDKHGKLKTTSTVIKLGTLHKILHCTTHSLLSPYTVDVKLLLQAETYPHRRLQSSAVNTGQRRGRGRGCRNNWTNKRIWIATVWWCYDSKFLVFPCILLCSSLYIVRVAPKRKCKAQTNWLLIVSVVVVVDWTTITNPRQYAIFHQARSRGTWTDTQSRNQRTLMENWNLLGLDKQAGLRSGQLKCVKGPCNIY